MAKGPLWTPGDGIGAFRRGLLTWNRDHRNSFRSSVVMLAGLIPAFSGTVTHGVAVWLGPVMTAALFVGMLLWFRRRLQRPYVVPYETVDGQRGSW